MAKRVKKVIHSGVTSEQMETAFAEYAAADARLAKINATMDEQITRIREKYSDDIAQLTSIKDNAFEIVQAYAQENREVLFAKKKSLDAAHGTYGFRTGTPKLKTLKGFTWEAVKNLLKEFLPKYVRVQEEPAKDKLLADREVKKVAENLAKCGITVVQDETFFIELKKEEQDA
ncbi:Mu-like prophage host-nuclease inhibitor protein Gam [Porphyromonadaceae bacterium KHP3R9]|nr:Mu-like prophage host-nuclease inhibitor protein Gam [Porphyromonadaceae bacterium KHP3R9]